MSSNNAAQDHLDRLEEQCRQLRNQCRILKAGLAVVALVALATPATLLMRTSLGSELRVGTVVADRLVLPKKGELLFEGDKPGEPIARMGYLRDRSAFGLVFADGERPSIALVGGNWPSLTMQKQRGESQLALGYVGHTITVTDVIGEPTMLMLGHDGKRRASLSIAGNGEPHLVLFDATGQRRCVDLFVSFFGRLSLRSPEEKDKQRGLDLSSYPKVEYLNEEGTPIVPK